MCQNGTLVSDLTRGTCNFLTLVYNPSNADDSQCNKETPELCKAGDLTTRFDQIKVASRKSRFSKQSWYSSELDLPPLNSYRSAYLVLYEANYPDSILACGRIRQMNAKRGRAFFSYAGVRGEVEVSQRSRFEPTDLQLNITGLAARASTFGVHTLPVPPRVKRDPSPCLRVGGIFNPGEVDPETTAPAGGDTHDQYAVGDFSGKHGRLNGLDSFESSVTDFRLPLWGPRSVMGRSLVFTTPTPGDDMNWICANIHDTRPTVTAAAVFRFPLGGRVLFVQPEDAPDEDTTVLVEGLLYNDGTMNGTEQHRWYVNELVPGDDFRNWTGRCLSAGDPFNPYQVSGQPLNSRELNLTNIIIIKETCKETVFAKNFLHL